MLQNFDVDHCNTVAMLESHNFSDFHAKCVNSNATESAVQ